MPTFGREKKFRQMLLNLELEIETVCKTNEVQPDYFPKLDQLKLYLEANSGNLPALDRKYIKQINEIKNKLIAIEGIDQIKEENAIDFVSLNEQSNPFLSIENNYEEIITLKLSKQLKNEFESLKDRRSSEFVKQFAMKYSQQLSIKAWDICTEGREKVFEMIDVEFYCHMHFLGHLGSKGIDLPHRIPTGWTELLKR